MSVDIENVCWNVCSNIDVKFKRRWSNVHLNVDVCIITKWRSNVRLNVDVYIVTSAPPFSDFKFQLTFVVFLLCILVLCSCFVVLVDNTEVQTSYFVLYIVDCLCTLFWRIFCFSNTVLLVWFEHYMLLSFLVLCGQWHLGSIFLCLVLIEHRLYHQCLVWVRLWHSCCNVLPVATSFSASFVSVVWFVHVARF